MKLNKSFQLIFISLVALVFTACERKADEQTSNLNLSMPSKMYSNKIGAQSAQDLAHLVINISGSGISSPILLTWSQHGPNGEILTAPSSFKFEVDRGNGRLIQVLAVYKSSSTSDMSFYYGSSAINFDKAEVSAAIPVSSIGQGDPVISGRISGRYLTATGTGPTGDVEIRYVPGLGKPEMVIERGTIVNGWFNLFALTGIKMRYVVSDGTVLWKDTINVDGTVSLDDARFTTNSEQIGRLSMPISKRKEYTAGASNSWNWEDEDASVHVYGWFGPAAASSNKVCRPFSGNFQNLSKFNGGPLPNLNASQPLSLTLSTSAASIPSGFNLTDTASAMSAAVFSFGADSSPCAGLTENITKISVNRDQFDGNGNDGAAPFYPPFTKMASGSGAFTLTASAGQFSLAGEFLPQIHPSYFDSIKIFKRTGNTSWSSHEDNISCTKIANGIHGFSPVAATITASGGAFAATNILTAAEANMPGTALVVCPTKAGTVGGYAEVIFQNSFSSAYLEPYSLLNSYITIASATIAASATTNAVLYVKDHAGNMITTGGLSVAFQNSYSGSSMVNFNTVTDNGNGTYSVLITGTSSGTATMIRATINGSFIQSTLPTITVNP